MSKAFFPRAFDFYFLIFRGGTKLIVTGENLDAVVRPLLRVTRLLRTVKSTDGTIINELVEIYHEVGYNYTIVFIELYVWQMTNKCISDQHICTCSHTQTPPHPNTHQGSTLTPVCLPSATETASRSTQSNPALSLQSKF